MLDIASFLNYELTLHSLDWSSFCKVYSWLAVCHVLLLHVVYCTTLPIGHTEKHELYVAPKNFGVAPDNFHQLLPYFTRLFGEFNRWRGINPKHF